MPRKPPAKKPRKQPTKKAIAKSKGGRPSLFDSDKTLQAAIEDYFAQCKTDETPLTISGLAYHLGMTTETLRAYGEMDKFSATVKRAKQRVEIYLETRLYGTSPAGTIFNLKNNFGWKDQQDHTLSAPNGGPVRWEVVGVEPNAR